MTADIIDLSQRRPCHAVLPRPVVLPFANPKDELTDAELAELGLIFPNALSRKALFKEAYEQALIEMHNGPVDLRAFPPIPSQAEASREDLIIKVRQLRLMVERTSELLREYLAAFRRIP